jgi:hypothetical protein
MDTIRAYVSPTPNLNSHVVDIDFVDYCPRAGFTFEARVLNDAGFAVDNQRVRIAPADWYNRPMGGIALDERAFVVSTVLGRLSLEEIPAPQPVVVELGQPNT